jgi:DNA-binding winged helix-turn-helix (wHTH) protein/Tfp pilus assembly protein PilF
MNGHRRIVDPILADGARANLQETIKRHAIGPLELDAERLILAARGEPLPLGPRVVATLAVLVERAGEVVTKDEILDRVWAGAEVAESNVPQSVYTLRKVLRAHGLDGAIRTVPRRGYRFVGPVAPAAARTPGLAARGFLRRAAVAAAVLLALVVAGSAVQPAAAVVPLSARGAERYRLGRYYWNLRTPDGFAHSARLFREVVRSDPRSALGYAGLADLELMRADYLPNPRKRAPYYARARAAIAAALTRDARCAPAYASLGVLVYAAHRDRRVAEAEYRRAIALDPAYAPAHHWLGILLFEEGRLRDASRELRTAVALEPVATATGAWLAEASYYGGQYADAIAYGRLALDLDPHRGGALRTVGLAYELAGDLPHAVAAFEGMRRSPTEASYAPALLAEAYARAGRVAAARAALRKARALHPRDADTGFALLALGERREGLAVLATMRRDPEHPCVDDPRIAPFRTALRALSTRRPS